MLSVKSRRVMVNGASARAWSGIIQLRIPIGAAPFRRHVEDGPQRHQVRCAARILSRIGRCTVHLTAPEMPDFKTVRFLPPREHVERRIITAVFCQCMIVAAELA